MSMAPALLDTNIVSLYLRGDATIAQALAQYLAEHEQPAISQITYYEILKGLFYRDARRQMQTFLSFATQCLLIPLTDASVVYAAECWASQRQAGRSVTDLDLLIAGTAVTERRVLISRNRRHFEGLPGLVVQSWLPPLDAEN